MVSSKLSPTNVYGGFNVSQVLFKVGQVPGLHSSGGAASSSGGPEGKLGFLDTPCALLGLCTEYKQGWVWQLSRAANSS